MRKQVFHRPEDIPKELQLAPGRQLTLTRPLVMGILNCTPDSFSDGGLHATPEMAVEHALKMEEQGADIIDVGGESTRPGAQPVEEDEEMQRVIPVIQRLRDLTDITISIDTYKAKVADAALKAGADIVNDVSALRFDTNLMGVVIEHKAPIILMHMQGTPRDMQNDPHYEDCVTEICVFFERRIKLAVGHGVDRSKILLDPGLGFGKRVRDNLEILARFNEFTQFKVPVIVAASRKGFIGHVHSSDIPAEERLGGSLAAAMMGIVGGASIVRAHDVKETVEALKVLQAVRSVE